MYLWRQRATRWQHHSALEPQLHCTETIFFLSKVTLVEWEGFPLPGLPLETVAERWNPICRGSFTA